MDSAAAAEVAAGESAVLKHDLEACTFESTHSLGAQWLPEVEKLDKKNKDNKAPEAPDFAALLVSWYLRENSAEAA